MCLAERLERVWTIKAPRTARKIHARIRGTLTEPQQIQSLRYVPIAAKAQVVHVAE